MRNDLHPFLLPCLFTLLLLAGACKKKDIEPEVTDLGTVTIQIDACEEMETDFPFFPVRNVQWVYEVKYECSSGGPSTQYHVQDIVSIVGDTVYETRTLDETSSQWDDAAPASPKLYYQLEGLKITYDENGNITQEQTGYGGQYHQDLASQRVYKLRARNNNGTIEYYDDLLWDFSLEVGDPVYHPISSTQTVQTVETIPFGCLNLKKISYGTGPSQWNSAYIEGWGERGMGYHEENPNTPYCSTILYTGKLVYGADTLVLFD